MRSCKDGERGSEQTDAKAMATAGGKSPVIVNGCDLGEGSP